MGDVRRKPAPKELQAAGKALWRQVLDEFEPNAAEFALLFQLCLTVDELADMKADLAEMGTVVMGSRNQPRVNPLIAVIAAHRKLVDQLVVALGVPLPGEAVGRRRSAAAKQSVDSRWRQEKRRGRLASVEPLRQEEGK
jgi:P27 family predicted phage terminase small subunit